MKEILNLKPIITKQMPISDPNVVLKYLKQLDNEILLQLLSEKLIILLSLLSGQRDQTLKALYIEHMVLEDSKCIFFIKEPLKTAKKKIHQPPIEFRSYPDNDQICVIKTLHDCIGKTKKMRTTG